MGKKGKVEAAVAAIGAATAIGASVASAVTTATDVAEKGSGLFGRFKKKEEKTFFDENRHWISLIILSIFVVKLDYINMFQDVTFNSIINILFGLIVLALVCLYFIEEKNIFKTKSNFVKVLVAAIIILGAINSIYHIAYAISILL